MDYQMTWRTAVRLLKMQGREPTERDRKLWEKGFVSHILYPKPVPATGEVEDKKP